MKNTTLSFFSIFIVLIIIPLLWVIFGTHPVSGEAFKSPFVAIRLCIMLSPLMLPFFLATLAFIMFSKKFKIVGVFLTIVLICIYLWLLSMGAPKWYYILALVALFAYVFVFAVLKYFLGIKTDKTIS